MWKHQQEAEARKWKEQQEAEDKKWHQQQQAEAKKWQEQQEAALRGRIQEVYIATLDALSALESASYRSMDKGTWPREVQDVLKTLALFHLYQRGRDITQFEGLYQTFLRSAKIAPVVELREEVIKLMQTDPRFMGDTNTPQTK